MTCMRLWWTFAILNLVAFCFAGSVPGTNISQRAQEIDRRALIFDAHVHMFDRQFYHGGSMGDRVNDGQVDLSRMREGELKAAFFTLFVSEEYYPERYETKQVLRLLDEAYRQIDLNRNQVGIALNASDIARLNKSGKIAAVLALEGGYDLDGDLGVLRMLYRLGLRSFQLPAHNWANNLADSCCAPARFNGLSEQGRAVIREANRLGMVIDVSHASDLAIQQAIDVSSDPIMSTHDGLKFFNNIPRTMSEATLRKLAAKGGLIGFHIGNEFHNRKLFEYRTQKAGKPFWDTSQLEKQAGRRLSIFDIDKIVAPQFPEVGINAPDELKFTVDDWFAVVDKAIEWVGEDHVMLGSDFDGGPTLPKPMRDIRDLPLLTEAMVKRGYSDERIRKFLGGNLLRVFRQITEKPPGQ